MPSSGSETKPTEPSIAARDTPKLRLVVIAGILTIVSGVLSLYNGIVGVDAGVGTGFDFYREGMKYWFCGIFLVAFGVVAILGGLLAIRGKHVLLAFVGAFLGMAGGGLIGFWLGLFAIVLLFLSDSDLTG